jgi:1-acyl-sn-glycerol-3-phosphate acyltransferase
MLKLFFVIFANFHRAPYIVPKMRYMADHPQKYSEAERYDMMRHCIDLMNKSGKITTEAYGLENLPETGVVDYNTWYEISNIYVAVTRIAELA